MTDTHITVLLDEAVDGLALTPDSIVVDATFGAGGHAKKILETLDSTGRYIGIDADQTALSAADLGEQRARIDLVHDNFEHISEIIQAQGLSEVDAILADLGWRMEQFSDADRGFSFMHDGPLHMTFGNPEDYPFTAEDIVNDWDEPVIADIIYGYADERYARRIAKRIVDARRTERITTTSQLVSIIESALPKAASNKRIHPATKTFQGLRIAVNSELSVLESFITNGYRLLRPGGRMAIITFHSIEDRIVKHSFRELAKADQVELVTKKPIIPTEEELHHNPRARSAKLRIISKK